jgi:O-antigen/teichoic acid export membrane protein
VVAAAETHPDLLASPEAGGRLIRGGVLRGIGYGVGTLIAAGTAVLLLRALGRDDFGRYGTVAALLGIVSGISDAGLTAVGSRELALTPAAGRPHLLRNLVTLRLAITPVGVVAAAVFAFFVYDRQMFWGTVLGGIGVLLVNTQATMMMPLSVDLKLGTVTLFEVAKTAFTFLFVLVFVAAGWKLVALLSVQIPVGVVVIALTPLAVPFRSGLMPGFDRRVVRSLVREALPLAVALTMNVVYFRVLMILMSLLSSKNEIGLYATSFQVFAVLFSLPLLVLSSALPLLSVAGRDDGERLRFGLQRMTEVALAASVFIVLAIVSLADVLIPLLGGEQYRDAAPVLEIQAFALIAVFLGQTWQLGLLSLRRQSALAWANGTALVVIVLAGLALIPAWGARGGAVAAVVGESFLALFVYVALRRTTPDVAPRLGLMPRAAAAAVPAIVVAFLPIPWELRLAGSLAVFTGGCVLLRAVPSELVAALLRR